MIFDVVVLAVLVISCIIAFLRGFIREVLTIFGVVGGAVAAFYLGPLAVPLTRNLLDVKEGGEPQLLFDLIPYAIVADVLTYSTIFLIVIILLSTISHFLAGTAKAVGLGALDRSLGVLFGLARGVLILAVLYLPVYMFSEQEARKEWFKGSRTFVYVETFAGWLSGFVPESLALEGEKQAGKAADSLKSTREKLQEIDILRRDSETEGKAAAEKTAPAGETETLPAEENAEPAPGYEEEQRRNMQDLIEEEVE